MLRASQSRKQGQGFTLAELLIALVILGDIAAFTIPKIITSQQNSKYNAFAKEAISSISVAYQQESVQNGITINTNANALTPYLNYLAVDTGSIVDNTGATNITCTSAGLNRCLKLHNGAMLAWHSGETFSGSGTTNGIWFLIDPDGIDSANTGLSFFVLYNGRISSSAQLPNITSSVSTYTTAADPTWFSW